MSHGNIFGSTESALPMNTASFAATALQTDSDPAHLQANAGFSSNSNNEIEHPSRTLECYRYGDCSFKGSLKRS
ncbi:MAG: hypothetical protein ABSG25_10655 [Bryobacteraceae bacterium]